MCSRGIAVTNQTARFAAIRESQPHHQLFRFRASGRDDEASQICAYTSSRVPGPRQQIEANT